MGNTTLTDPRSQRTQASRRGGQIIMRARSSSNSSACPLHVLPTPLSWLTQDTAGAPSLPARRWRRRKSCLIIIVLNRTIAASRAAFDGCGVSRTTNRLNAFAVSMANSAISSVLDAVITRSSPPPSAAPASSKLSELRSTSCRLLERSGAVRQGSRLVARELTDPRERHESSGRIRFQPIPNGSINAALPGSNWLRTNFATQPLVLASAGALVGSR